MLVEISINMDLFQKLGRGGGAFQVNKFEQIHVGGGFVYGWGGPHVVGTERGVTY